MLATCEMLNERDDEPGNVNVGSPGSRVLDNNQMPLWTKNAQRFSNHLHPILFRMFMEGQAQ